MGPGGLNPVLEQFLQKTRGLVLAAIVVLLSAVFVLQFGGPQAQGCSSGGATTAAVVDGRSISRGDLRAAYVLVGGDRYPAELARQNRLEEMVLQGLVEEALLADQARELGFVVTEDDVMEQVIEEGLIHVAMSVDAGPYLPPAGPRRYDFTDKDGNFSKENLKRFIQGGLQRSVRDFTETQMAATLAQRMREVVMSSVEVGEREIWNAYVREHEKATITYARFSPSYFASSLTPSKDELDAYIQGAGSVLDEAYEKQKHRYTGLEKQVRARHILLKLDASADEAQRQEVEAAAQKLLARAQAGEDFASLAQEFSDDPSSAKKGGDLGFNPKGRMVAPFDEAQFALQPGEITAEPVKSNFGYHIIKVEAVREGDVPVDEAKREIAEQLWRKQQSEGLAAKAASTALAQLNDGMEADAISATLPGAAAEGEEADPLAPQFRESRSFGRGDSPIAGAFDSNPVAQAAFELTTDSPLPKEAVKLGEDYVVFKLLTKAEAKSSDFEEDKERLRLQLLSNRRNLAVADYVRSLVRKASANGQVTVSVAEPESAEG